LRAVNLFSVQTSMEALGLANQSQLQL